MFANFLNFRRIVVFYCLTLFSIECFAREPCLSFSYSGIDNYSSDSIESCI